ncbi:FecR family protein [Caulobacter sp. UC70_42]|uniref:FecR family protein n=1 Tax=Caulobacter sp. UC70_42 TaxID=3374551 RepID=UPI003757430B
MTDQREIPRSTREAADWLTRLNDDKLPDGDIEAFSAWRAVPENRAAYERLEDLSQSLRLLANDPDIEAVAASAMTGTTKPKVHFIGRGRRGYFVLGAALAAALIGGVSATLVFRPPSYSTGVGETFSARLDDGSRVTLNTDSRVRIRYSKGERRVELVRGQAFFDVAHNAARPFIVAAGDTETRALGTKFEVRRTADGVRVTLTQGSIVVTDRDKPSATWRLVPGQALALSPRSVAAAKPVAVDAKASSSWTTGDVTFQDVPLSAAVAELNRYSRRKIVLADGVDANRVVNGVFSSSDTTDFVDAVTTLFGLDRVAKSNGDVELQPKVRRAS